MKVYKQAFLAQLVEQLICNQKVRGSNPLKGRNENTIFHIFKNF
jgi:hypothetical protein